MRFREAGWDDDPVLRAAAMCAIVDLAMLPAARRGFTEPWLVPSLDLHCAVPRCRPPAGRRRRVAPGAATLAGSGRGTVGGLAEVWTQRGRLVATAMQQMTAIAPTR